LFSFITHNTTINRITKKSTTAEERDATTRDLCHWGITFCRVATNIYVIIPHVLSY